MEWHERLLTKIKVGEVYEMREGTVWKVVEKLNEDNFYLIKNPPPEGFVDINYRKTHIVDSYGRFGNYPNPLDLVKKVIK